MPRRGFFITATGTDAGKTVVTTALALALRRHHPTESVAAVKPMETGCATPDVAADASALAKACGQPLLANHEGFFRAAPPLAPAAAALELGQTAPTVAATAAACLNSARSQDWLLVEGAGGILVPLNATETMADLAQALGLALVLVAPDSLGTLSHTLAAFECIDRRQLAVCAVVLNQHAPSIAVQRSDASNQALLAARLPCPVLTFPRLDQPTPEQLVAAAQQSDLLYTALRSCP